MTLPRCGAFRAVASDWSGKEKTGAVLGEVAMGRPAGDPHENGNAAVSQFGVVATTVHGRLRKRSTCTPRRCTLSNSVSSRMQSIRSLRRAGLAARPRQRLERSFILGEALRKSPRREIQLERAGGGLLAARRRLVLTDELDDSTVQPRSNVLVECGPIRDTFSGDYDAHLIWQKVDDFAFVRIWCRLVHRPVRQCLTRP